MVALLADDLGRRRLAEEAQEPVADRGPVMAGLPAALGPNLYTVLAMSNLALWVQHHGACWTRSWKGPPRHADGAHACEEGAADE